MSTALHTRELCVPSDDYLLYDGHPKALWFMSRHLERVFCSTLYRTFEVRP
jgi:hypothetical protein